MSGHPDSDLDLADALADEVERREAIAHDRLDRERETLDRWLDSEPDPKEMP